jgi:NAD(P)-dependent dehydrogenase (short-subunit alcohol dehydrogenase family)
MPDLALVCGGSGVLGSALVEAFRARGDRVVVADRAAGVADEPGVVRRAVDLTSPDAVEELWDGLEAPPRWVVNAVGGFRAGRVADSDPDDLRFMLDLNLGTAWWSCRAAARRRAAGAASVNGGGRNRR